MKDFYLETQIDEGLVGVWICFCSVFRGIKLQVVDGLSAAETAVSMLCGVFQVTTMQRVKMK